jgi:hypothetical protein
VLVPKIASPQRINDYRPISLVHSFPKIITKILSNRLGPKLQHLISNSQTAFLKKRCIHDCFVFVQQVIKALHKKKVPALFIKLDIHKAFDTLDWHYLLNILTHLGFGQTWRDWISSLWCTFSSAFLLNGNLGRRILHYRGVRQGDPLSTMLFQLAMEPLQLLFRKAQEMGLLWKLHPICDAFRVSMNADDAALFLNPTKHDLDISDFILKIFSEASGLVTNLSKTQYFPIKCNENDLALHQDLGRQVSSFPYTYLGMPLHFRKWLAGSLGGRGGSFHTQAESWLLNQCCQSCQLTFLQSSKCPRELWMILTDT